MTSVVKFYLLMLAKGYFCPARKAARHANYRDRSSHNSLRFVRIVIERRKEALRKFSGLLVFYGVCALRAIRRRGRELRPSGRRGADSLFYLCACFFRALFLGRRALKSKIY